MSNKDDFMSADDLKRALSFMDLVPSLKALLKKEGFQYFGNVRKDALALNNFMLDGLTPNEVIILAKKLIAIKRHPDYKANPFWVSATLTVAGLYSYQVQINNIYEVIAPPPFGFAQGTGEEDKWIEHCKSFIAKGKSIRAFDDLPNHLKTEKVKQFYLTYKEGVLK